MSLQSHKTQTRNIVLDIGNKSFTGISVVSLRATEMIDRIDKKCEQLLTSKKISERDVKSLRARLSFVWCAENRSQEVSLVTSWRDTIAREVYSDVQEINNHLLLPFILAVPPTACSTPAFRKVMQILQHRRYKTYRLELSLDWKETLESIAIYCDIGSHVNYQKLMQSLFPQSR